MDENFRSLENRDKEEITEVWVDTGGWDNETRCQIPMSVIDLHPSKWRDPIKALFIPPEHWHRFKRFVLADSNAKTDANAKT